MDERRQYIVNWNRHLPGLMDNPEAVAYMMRVRDFCELMQPGQKLRLLAEGPKQHWLWVAIGAFLCEGSHGDRYELDDDYLFLCCFA